MSCTESTSWRTKATTRPFSRSTPMANSDGKIPATYDLDGPSGTPLALFKSGAILLYLADKTGQLFSADPNTLYEQIQWVMWQISGSRPDVRSGRLLQQIRRQDL